MKFKTTTKQILQELVKKQYQLEEEFGDKKITVEIKKYSQSRSLLQNAKYWAILDKIAKADKNDIKNAQDLHKKYICEYGVPIDTDKRKSTVKVLQEALPLLKESIKYYRQIGIKEEAENKFVYIQVMKGSSQMTMYEMYEIILAVIQEAEDLGIDVSYESNELKSLLENTK